MIAHRFLHLALTAMLGGALGGPVAAAERQGNFTNTADGQSTILARTKHDDHLLVRMEKNVATDVVALEFDTASLPKQATLTSCGIHIAVESVSARLLLKLTGRAGGAQWAYMVVDSSSKPGTGVILRSERLCEEVAGAMATNDLLSVTLEAVTKTTGVAKIHGESATDARNRPRLVVGYELNDPLRRDGGWLQTRHNAQHDGRSSWRIHDAPASRDCTAAHEDPGACVSWPTAYDERQVRGVETNVVGVWQSPLLVDGDVVVASDRNKLQVTTRGGAQYAQIVPSTIRYLAAAPQGRLIVVAEDGLYLLHRQDDGRFSPPDKLVALGEHQTPLAPIAVAADGTVFMVAGKGVHAYRLQPPSPSPSPSPSSPPLLWSNSYHDMTKASAIALGNDEATAYLLLRRREGHLRLLALDTATGRCRWEGTIEARAGANDPMPIPVVSGRMILINDGYPAGKKLTVFKEEPRGNDMPAKQGEVMGPAGSGTCGDDKVASYNLSSDSPTIPTPVAASREGQAYVLKDGGLHLLSVDWKKPGDEIPLPGCSVDELKAVTRIVGDSGGGKRNTPTRLYGLAPSGRLVFIEVRWNQKKAWGRCRAQSAKLLGDNLLISDDGLLFNHSSEHKVTVFVPNLKASPGLDLVQAMKDGDKAGTVFRARVIETTAPLVLDARTDIVLQAADKIVFRSKFSVKSGAALRARVGDLNPYPSPPAIAAK